MMDISKGRRPPLISVDTIPFELVQPSSGGLVHLVLGGAPLVAVLLSELGHPVTTVGVVPLALAGAWLAANIALGVWRFLKPDSLTITKSGFVFRTLWRLGDWAWPDVRNFKGIRSRNGDWVEFESDQSAPFWRAPIRLAGDWPDLKADQTAALLNHAKARFDPKDGRQTLGAKDKPLEPQSV